jgi:glycosyltransferase involved in cell wall biosynthesis
MGGLRCLYLARAIPLPLTSGDNVYTARLAQALAAAEVSVTFMGLASSAVSSQPRAQAFDSRIEWRIVPGRPNPTVIALASPMPLVAARFRTRNYMNSLKAMLLTRDFDAVILDHYAMAWAVNLIQKSESNGTRLPIVYIAHNFETQVSADIARNFRGNLFRKTALHANAWKIALAERSLARSADLIAAHTAEDTKSIERLSPFSAKLVLPPAYQGPRVPDRLVTQAMPRRVAVLGNYRWMAKQINLAAFLETADPIFQNAGVGLDVVGDGPDSFRKVWEARVKATQFHGFIEDIGQFLATRRIGVVVEETGGGFKNKVLDYIFNGLPIAAIRGSMAGLPLTEGVDYLCFESMRELAQGVAAAIDDIERLNYMQHAAYKKCESGFDWSDRGRTLRNAIQQVMNRRRVARATRSTPSASRGDIA